MRLIRLCFVLSVVVLALAGCRGTDVLDADQSSAQNLGLAQSGDQTVPFFATIDNTIEVVPPFPPPILNAIFEGVGESEPFGPFELFSTSQVDITVVPASQITTGWFTYRNGDELHWTSTGTSTEDPPGTTVFSGSWTFTGGTGRFTNATGNAIYAGSADLVTAIGHFTVDGVISGFGGRPGGKRDWSH